MILWILQVDQGILAQVKRFLEIAAEAQTPVESNGERDRSFVGD
jgi:hypothetical protein